jgi:hypothetical protein
MVEWLMMSERAKGKRQKAKGKVGCGVKGRLLDRWILKVSPCPHFLLYLKLSCIVFGSITTKSKGGEVGHS